MSVTVSSDAMTAVVTKALYDGLTQEQRDKLVSDAIASLLTAPKNEQRGYYSTQLPSPLQEAFNDAAIKVAQQLARDKLVNDEAFRKQVDDVLVQTVKRVFAGEGRDALIEKLADRLASAFERY